MRQQQQRYQERSSSQPLPSPPPMSSASGGIVGGIVGGLVGGLVGGVPIPGSSPTAISMAYNECRHCEVIFKNQILFELHMGLHSRTDPFQCNMCGNKCGDAVNFFLHVKNHAHTGWMNFSLNFSMNSWIFQFIFQWIQIWNLFLLFPAIQKTFVYQSSANLKWKWLRKLSSYSWHHRFSFWFINFFLSLPLDVFSCVVSFINLFIYFLFENQFYTFESFWFYQKWLRSDLSN